MLSALIWLLLTKRLIILHKKVNHHDKISKNDFLIGSIKLGSQFRQYVQHRFDGYCYHDIIIWAFSINRAVVGGYYISVLVAEILRIVFLARSTI